MKKLFINIIINYIKRRINNLIKLQTMKNWRTSLLGAIVGGLTAIQPLLTTGTFNWSHDYVNVILGFAIAALGFLAKDSAVTGTGV